MIPPRIEQSTREERRAFGKCRVLRGKDAEILYADYIEGRRAYMEITMEIRNNNYFT
jgi:hypothetical protein